jgi:hypothetical protein
MPKPDASAWDRLETLMQARGATLSASRQLESWPDEYGLQVFQPRPAWTVTVRWRCLCCGRDRRDLLVMHADDADELPAAVRRLLQSACGRGSGC